MELHGLRTGVAAAPATVFITFLPGGFADARGAVATSLSVAPPTIHVQGPELIGNGVAGGAIESGKIRVPSDALQLQDFIPATESWVRMWEAGPPPRKSPSTVRSKLDRWIRWDVSKEHCQV
jgi:hypothetical protein